MTTLFSTELLYLVTSPGGSKAQNMVNVTETGTGSGLTKVTTVIQKANHRYQKWSEEQ